MFNHKQEFDDGPVYPKQEKQIQCNTNLNIVTSQCLVRKIVLKFFDFTGTMFFFTKYFQEKKVIYLLKSPFWMKRFRLKIWSFHEQNGWKKKKKPLDKFFELNFLRKKGLSMRWKQNDNLNHVPFKRKGLKSLGEQNLKCLTKKFKQKMLSKSNILYTIGKLLKHRYQK